MTGADYERARTLLKEGEYAAAEQLLRRVVQADEHHQVAWDRLGWALASQGQFDEERRCVERAIEEARKKHRVGGREYDIARFYTTLGAVHCLAGEAEKALAALENADPSNWYNMYWKACSLKSLGRVQEALSMAEEAQKRAPKPLLPPLRDEIQEMIAECQRILGAQT